MIFVRINWYANSRRPDSTAVATVSDIFYQRNIRQHNGTELLRGRGLINGWASLAKY